MIVSKRGRKVTESKGLKAKEMSQTMEEGTGRREEREEEMRNRDPVKHQTKIMQITSPALNLFRVREEICYLCQTN